MKYSSLVLLFLAVLCLVATSSAMLRPAVPKRVAIIGAGIGGSTCAYYLHQESKLSPDVEYEIHLFEKNSRVGGRIRSFLIEDEVLPSESQDKHDLNRHSYKHKGANEQKSGNEAGNKIKLSFELGAAVWAAPNLLLDDLAEELSIEVETSNENAGTEDFSVKVFEGGLQKTSYDLELGDLFSLSTLRTASQMEKFKTNLLENYLELLPRDYGLHKAIEENKYSQPPQRVSNSQTSPWRSIEEWTRHGDINKYTSTTTLDYLKRYGVDANYTKRNIEPFTRVIYDQDTSANAFAGLVALVASDQTRVAKNGLQSMVNDIIVASKAKLRLQTHVEAIEAVEIGEMKQRKYKLTFSNPMSSKPKENNPNTNDIDIKNDSMANNASDNNRAEIIDNDNIFDIVVLAAPIEFLDISFKNIPSIQSIKKREYVGKTSTYIRAKGLNEKFFNVSETNALLTNQVSDDNGVGFYSIVPHYKYSNGDYLFKVFSKLPMSEIPGSLQNWFREGVLIEQQNWQYTFPKLHPKGDSASNLFQPIIIEDNLYYTSAIDSVAVAMEASTLAAHNIANMIVNDRVRASSHHSAPCFSHSYLLSPYLKYLDTLNQNGEIFLLGYIVLGAIYVMTGLSWVTTRFNFLFLLSLIFMGHTVGYWLEAAVSKEILDTSELHGHAVLIAADVFGGILVGLGTFLGDSILPMAMLARTVAHLDIWGMSGAVVGLITWPIISDSLLSMLSLISRFFGGSTPSLSILDVASSTAITVSVTLVTLAIASASLTSHKNFPWYKTLFVASLLSFTHIGYVSQANLLGTTSLWTRLVPSHVASYLHQDGLAAIVDPLSSTQTCILALVPCFLFGAHMGKWLLACLPSSSPVQVQSEIAPRFSGPTRFLGSVILILGMALHSGSYAFLTAFTLTMCVVGII